MDLEILSQDFIKYTNYSYGSALYVWVFIPVYLLNRAYLACDVCVYIPVSVACGAVECAGRFPGPAGVQEACLLSGKVPIVQPSHPFLFCERGLPSSPRPVQPRDRQTGGRETGAGAPRSEGPRCDSLRPGGGPGRQVARPHWWPRRCSGSVCVMSDPLLPSGSSEMKAGGDEAASISVPRARADERPLGFKQSVAFKIFVGNSR